jgi:hypothetical protein
MTYESATELSENVESRWALPFAVLVWTAGALCVAFTTCYAYHIGV